MQGITFDIRSSAGSAGSVGSVAVPCESSSRGMSSGSPLLLFSGLLLENRSLGKRTCGLRCGEVAVLCFTGEPMNCVLCVFVFF